MEQERRDAAAWAQEWAIRKKNRRIIAVIAAVIFIAALCALINYISIITTRMTFASEEEMRAYMQGRFALDRYYEDVIIEGDDVTLTYYEVSHYDRDYAENYGYSEEFEDSVYDDRIIGWEYKTGTIKTEWMGDMYVDKDGNLHRESYETFYRTDKPKPEPIDPSTLTNNGAGEEALTDEEAETLERRDESLEATEDAAENAAENAVDEGAGDAPENGEAA